MILTDPNFLASLDPSIPNPNPNRSGMVPFVSKYVIFTGPRSINEFTALYAPREDAEQLARRMDRIVQYNGSYEQGNVVTIIEKDVLDA